MQGSGEEREKWWWYIQQAQNQISFEGWVGGYYVFISFSSKNAMSESVTRVQWLTVKSWPAPSTLISFERAWVSGGSMLRMRGAYFGLMVMSSVPCIMESWDEREGHDRVKNVHGWVRHVCFWIRQMRKQPPARVWDCCTGKRKERHCNLVGGLIAVSRSGTKILADVKVGQGNHTPL